MKVSVRTVKLVAIGFCIFVASMIILSLTIGKYSETGISDHDTIIAGEKDNDIVPSMSVKVKGLVNKPLELNLHDLKKMEPKVQMDLLFISYDNKKKEKRNYSGILLTKILDMAGINRREIKKYYILIGATDGYYVTISGGELFNSQVENQMFLAYERDGKPLDEKEGYISLVIPTDKYIGERHVWRVNLIEVKDGV